MNRITRAEEQVCSRKSSCTEALVMNAASWTKSLRKIGLSLRNWSNDTTLVSANHFDATYFPFSHISFLTEDFPNLQCAHPFLPMNEIRLFDTLQPCCSSSTPMPVESDASKKTVDGKHVSKSIHPCVVVPHRRPSSRRNISGGSFMMEDCRNCCSKPCIL